MKAFLQEYWLWILTPFLIVIGGIVVLSVLAGGQGSSEFIYNVF